MEIGEGRPRSTKVRRNLRFESVAGDTSSKMKKFVAATVMCVINEAENPRLPPAGGLSYNRDTKSSVVCLLIITRQRKRTKYEQYLYYHNGNPFRKKIEVKVPETFPKQASRRFYN